MVSKLNKKELKMCLDQRGLDYNAEASNAALKEILLAHLKRRKANMPSMVDTYVTLLEHPHVADACVTLLEDPHGDCRQRVGALSMLGILKPWTLAQHAYAVIERLNDSNRVQGIARRTLHYLPGFVTQDIDFQAANLRSRLLGRLGWYKYRLRMRVRRLALYWYALPYRPSGPGHARDVDAWRQLTIEEYSRSHDADIVSGLFVVFDCSTTFVLHVLVLYLYLYLYVCTVVVVHTGTYLHEFIYEYFVSVSY